MSDPVQIIAEGRFLRFAKRQNWEYVERVNVRDVAVLVPITSEDEIVLVEQFRIPVQARMIELPAGLVGDEEEFREEDLLDAANRELEEETGYRAERLTLLTRAPSSGGMTSELVSFLHASGLRKVGSGDALVQKHYVSKRSRGVDGEDITVHVVPLREARRWLRGKEADGFLLDPKIHAGLYLVRPALSR